MGYKEVYEIWCNDKAFNDETKSELLAIKNNETEIKDRFYQDLEFGTAGLRGIIGAGTNRMNIYTVGRATEGLANYITKRGIQNASVAIAYDSRRMSKEFSEQTALCLNAHGIKTYIFSSERPTPELSYAVRKLNCTSGIVVTASHNPPDWNGYKAYWNDGGQIVPPIDSELIAEVNSITNFSIIKTMDKELAVEQGLFNVIPSDFDTDYLNQLKKQIINENSIKEYSKDIKIVYTPLHGTGGMLVKRLLEELGFANVYMVKEQFEPDGEFPTVETSNPEDPRSFELALKLAKEVSADIVLANDPDADRLGMFVKSSDGEYKLFNGNMTASLMCEYILNQKKDKGTLAANSAIIKTIVSTNLTDEIAKAYNVKQFEVLTGFKNIAKVMLDFDKTKEHECVFSYEESYGCNVGTCARDKDGIVAVMTLCEMVCFYKAQNKNLWDVMLEIYEKYGYYKEIQHSITMKGADGAEQIGKLMTRIRENPPKAFGAYEVHKFYDYKISKYTDIKTGMSGDIMLPKSNVLYFELANNAWVCARPSGTEPKIKFYIGVKGTSAKDAEEKVEELKAELMKMIR